MGSDTAGKIISWIGVISAGVTVALTVVNASTSNRIRDTELRLDRQRIELEAGRDKIAALTF